jgi:hypothetical protein
VFATNKGAADAAEVLRFGPTEAVVNEISADYDFRVESNANTHMLFVDGGNDRIGMNRSAPIATLHVADTSSYQLVLEHDSSTGNAGLLLKVAANDADQQAKSGVMLEQTDSYGRGKLHFLQDAVADSGNAALADSKAYFDYDGTFVVGSPAGIQSGAGNINAVNVYDDGVKLTDYVFDLWVDGRVKPEDAELAREYEPMEIGEFRQYLKDRRHLPAVRGRKEWSEKGPFSVGQLATALLQEVERQATYICDLEARIAALEGR